MEGQIDSTLRYLSVDDSGGVLPLTDDIVRQLREKHPGAQRAKLGSLLFGPVEDIPDSVYQEINGELVREAASRTKGSGGPSGVDANCFKRILACKSFKRSSINLCESIATLTRRLCTEFVSLRGRRLKGKGKGVCAKNARGARGGKEGGKTGRRFPPSLLARPSRFSRA